MSNMENILHLYLCKLRIISKIPVGGKLNITQNDLNIYYGGLFGWLFRKAYGDNKDNAAKYLVDLYREINSFSEQLMYNIEIENSEVRKRKKIAMLVSITEKLKESLTGVRNLIGTYKSYLKIVSLLECLEQDVIIPQYRILLKFIPDVYHTEILKTVITYSHTHSAGIYGRFRSLSENDRENIDTVDRYESKQIPSNAVVNTDTTKYITENKLPKDKKTNKLIFRAENIDIPTKKKH